MRRGDVTRRTEAQTRRARASTARPAHARRDRRRSVGTTTRVQRGTRSASPVSTLREPSRRCDEHKTSAADRISPESVRRTTSAADRISSESVRRTTSPAS